MQVEALPTVAQCSPSRDDIKEILAQCFSKYKIAYVITESKSMLALHWKSVFYVFHPEGKSEEGQYVRACTNNFEAFSGLVEHLVAKIDDHPKEVLFGSVKVLVLK